MARANNVAWVVIAVTVIASSGAGCKKDPEALVNEHRAAAQAKLEAIQKAAAVADEFKYMTFDWPKDAVNGLDFTSEQSNAIFVLRDDLDDLRKESSTELRFARLDDDPYRYGQRLLGLVAGGTGNTSDNPAPFYEDQLKKLERTRYVLVVVTSAQDMPIISATMVEGSKAFEPGKVEGVGLLIDLEGHKFLGGFEYAATNSDSIRATEKMAQDEAEEDLANQFGKAITKGTETRFPGAKVPGTFGFGW